MANISVTAICNLRCDYCFARAALDGCSQSAPHMPLSVYERVLGFLERSGINQVRLLGGEPTLHPQRGPPRLTGTEEVPATSKHVVRWEPPRQ